MVEEFWLWRLVWSTSIKLAIYSPRVHVEQKICRNGYAGNLRGYLISRFNKYPRNFLSSKLIRPTVLDSRFSSWGWVSVQTATANKCKWQLLIKYYFKCYKPPPDFANQTTPVQITLFVCTINTEIIFTNTRLCSILILRWTRLYCKGTSIQCRQVPSTL